MEDQINTRPAWMDDALVQNIPERKLQFLREIFADNHGKNQRDMMLSLLPAIRKAKERGLTLTPSEMSAAIAAIRKYSTMEELSKIDNILNKTQKT